MIKTKNSYGYVNNSADPDTGKASVDFKIDTNGFKDEGDGKITFPKGLTITDNSEQRNGTKYDIKTMDLSEYNGKLTADHSWSIQDILGKTFGVKKIGNRVVVEGIQFAVEASALARFAYNLLKEGFLTDFSIETYGPWPDDDGIYHDSKLIGLSAVVTGNNKSAEVNAIAQNSIQQAKKDGLDTSLVENKYVCYDNSQENENNDNKTNPEEQMFVTIVNSNSFAVNLTYKNAAGVMTSITLSAGQSFDVSSDQKESLEAQVKNAVAPTTETVKDEETSEQKMTKAVQAAIAPLIQKIEALEQQSIDASAEEPTFQDNKSKGAVVEIAKMGWRQRHGQMIMSAWDAFKNNNVAAQNKLNEFNKVHLEMLKEKGFVDNSITIGDMGNFVISPELLTEIEGHRSNFKALLERFTFRDTLSQQMAWLNRSGDINMQEVEMCDDDADGNLKPISEYGASIQTSNLHELAAVTPVCNAATRFLAADLLTDVAEGYRTDYDRKRAQLIIARLQQAVNANGNEVIYNTAAASLVNPLNSIINVAAGVAEEVEGGVWIFNTKTYYELLRRAMAAGINTDSGFGMFSTGSVRQLVGSDYIVVPNELMPTLNTAETKSFVVEGVTVTITEAMFYADPSTWSGRSSGGLMYDMSTDAAYEVGEVVQSAFQRNELVLRGSFFRGGAIRDIEKVAGLKAPGVS